MLLGILTLQKPRRGVTSVNETTYYRIEYTSHLYYSPGLWECPTRRTTIALNIPPQWITCYISCQQDTTHSDRLHFPPESNSPLSQRYKTRIAPYFFFFKQ